MALAKFQEFVVDGKGNVLVGASVNLYETGTTTEAQLYSDRAGTTTVTQPILTDGNGQAEFHVVPGIYDLKAELGGVSTTLTDYEIGAVTLIDDTVIDDARVWSSTKIDSAITVAVDAVEIFATQEADRAEAAAVEAENARDAAQLTAGIYADTTAGLAATTDGEYFSVPSAESDEFLILYRNDAGSATEIDSYPNSAAVENRVRYVPDIAALRALTGLQDGQQIHVVSYYDGWAATVAGPVGGGPMTVDLSDTTTADNGGSVFVTADGARVKRPMNGVSYIKDWGARGDLSQNDRTFFQSAFDNLGIGSRLLINPGNYRIDGSDPYLLSLTRNISIEGAAARNCRILGPINSPASTVLEINFQDNAGLGDVRNWWMRDVTISAQSGKHAVELTGGMAVLTSEISNCNLSGNWDNGGYSLYFSDPGNFAHSLIEKCTLTTPIYAKFGDCNIIRKNNIFGENGPAITLDLSNGIYNNTIENNTLVARDGALHVINGQAVRFLNNQCEQFQAYGENQSAPSAMVYAEGRDRVVRNLVISENNLGGGTNVDYLVYLDNAQHCVISKNQMAACDVAEIYCTANSKFNIYEFDNTVRTQDLNPRADGFFKAKIVNDSAYNIQMPISVTTGVGGSLLNGWTVDGAPLLFKSKTGHIIFTARFSGGTTTPGTVIATLPEGVRPYFFDDERLPVNGLGVHIESGDWVEVNRASGEIRAGKISSNGGFQIPPFLSEIDSTDF